MNCQLAGGKGRSLLLATTTQTTLTEPAIALTYGNASKERPADGESMLDGSITGSVGEEEAEELLGDVPDAHALSDAALQLRAERAQRQVNQNDEPDLGDAINALFPPQPGTVSLSQTIDAKQKEELPPPPSVPRSWADEVEEEEQPMDTDTANENATAKSDTTSLRGLSAGLNVGLPLGKRVTFTPLPPPPAPVEKSNTEPKDHADPAAAAGLDDDDEEMQIDEDADKRKKLAKAKKKALLLEVMKDLKRKLAEEGECTSSSSSDDDDENQEKQQLSKPIPVEPAFHHVNFADAMLKWAPKDAVFGEWEQYRFQTRDDSEAFYLVSLNWADPAEERFKLPSVFPPPSVVTKETHIEQALSDLRKLASSPRLQAFMEVVNPKVLEKGLLIMQDDVLSNEMLSPLSHYLRRAEKLLKEKYGAAKQRAVPGVFLKRVQQAQLKEDDNKRKSELSSSDASTSTPSSKGKGGKSIKEKEKPATKPLTPVQHLHAKVEQLRHEFKTAAEKRTADLKAKLSGFEEFRIGSLGLPASPELLEFQTLAFVADPIAMMDARRCRSCGSLHTKLENSCEIIKQHNAATAAVEREEEFHPDSIFAVHHSTTKEPADNQCTYALCMEKKQVHNITACPTLHAKCVRCLFRGHTDDTTYNGKLVCPDEKESEFGLKELGNLFEQSADKGLISRHRRQHPPLGFFGFSSKAEASVLTSLTFENLGRAGVAKIRDLCTAIRHSTGIAMSGIGERSKEYQRQPADDLAEAKKNIVGRRCLIQSQVDSHREGIQHQLAVVAACEEFLELKTGTRPAEHTWARERITEAVAAMRKEKAALFNLLASHQVMERGSAQSSWSSAEIWKIIGPKAQGLLTTEETKPTTINASGSMPPPPPVSTYAGATRKSKRAATGSVSSDISPPKAARSSSSSTATKGQSSKTHASSQPSAQKSTSREAPTAANVHVVSTEKIKASLTAEVRRRLTEGARIWVKAFDDDQHLKRESDLTFLTEHDLAALPSQAKEWGASRVFKYAPLKDERWIKILGRYWAKHEPKYNRFSFRPDEIHLKRAKAKAAMLEDDEANRKKSRSSSSPSPSPSRSRSARGRGSGRGRGRSSSRGSKRGT